MAHSCPAELKRLYREGRVLPFIGAGTSMSVSWDDAAGNRVRGPSWREMVDQAANILGFSDPELLRMRGTDLQILEYFKIKKKNLAPLNNWMNKLLDAPDSAICSSILHRHLANLVQCRVFYTTNYDDFLERSFVLFGRSVEVVSTEEDMGFGGSSTQIVKFHGDFNNPDHMVATERDYYGRMRLDGPMDLKLRSDIFGRAVLFVGYSFSDMNVAYLFHTVNEMFSRLPHSFSGKRAYIVVHNPSDFELRLFNARNVEVIAGYGPDRTTAVSEILADLAAS